MSVADVATEFETRAQLRTCLRYLAATAAARVAGVGQTGLEVFEHRHPRSTHLDAVRRQSHIHQRAAVPAGSSETWMAPFTEPQVFPEAFALAVRRRSALGQLPGAILVPPNVRAPVPTGAAVAGWVGVGAAIPVSKGAFTDITLTPLMLAGIVASTTELLKAAGPQAEATFEALLTRAAVEAADTALLDPAQAGVPETSPGSITNGAFTTPSTGSTVAALQADLGVVATHMQDQGVPLVSPVVILSPASALRAGGLTVPAPGGGQSLAVPTVLTPAAKDQVILLDASLLAYTDGGINVTVSTEGTLEMSDTPTADADVPTGATAPLVSLWQANAAAFRLVQYLNWQLAHPAAVGVVTGFGVTP